MKKITDLQQTPSLFGRPTFLSSSENKRENLDVATETGETGLGASRAPARTTQRL